MGGYLYNIALVTHVVGITLAAGATVFDFVIVSIHGQNRSKSILDIFVSETIHNKVSRLIGVGMLLIILSGIGMMAFLHGVWGQQTWFRIKMIILVIIVVNAIVVRRLLGIRFQKMLQAEDVEVASQQLLDVRRNIRIVQIVQMLLFVTIFVLSIFKFN
jgi:hypothetical protein